MKLKGAHILVVEEHPRRHGTCGNLGTETSTVIGPANDLAAALRLAESACLSAAVLDFRLERGDTLPIAARLAERGIPFLFQTSDARAVLDARPDALVLSKPVAAETLVFALETLL